MKYALLIASILMTPLAGAADCLRCGEMDHLRERMRTVKPDIANRQTADAQEAILDKGSDLVFSIMNKKTISLETAKSLLSLTAKLLPYDQATMIPQDNILKFQAHYNRCDNNTFRPAIDQLVAERKISTAEKNDLLENFDVVNKPLRCAK